MEDLKKFRDEIDRIDQSIVALFEERMAISAQVADYKIKTGKKVFDRAREIEKLNTLKAKTSNTFNQYGVEELFRQIMSMSRKLQYQRLQEHGVLGRLPFISVDQVERENVRVVFQGAEGAYSQAAMKRYFQENITSFHVDQWNDAMEAIAEGSADFAVLPIENSTAGAVSEVYDLLVEFENYIVGEQIVPCDHRLLGLPGAKLEDIKRVYSHPQALMQCRSFLDQYRNWKQMPLENTAIAAKKVSMDGDHTQVAIAGEFAGEYFGLQRMIDESICSNEGNSTRFIVVTNQRIFYKEANKISIYFELPHVSGALYNILSHFIYNNLSMLSIESRPIAGRNWEYRFFVDFEGNLNDGAVKNALRGIRDEALNLKILGNY